MSTSPSARVVGAHLVGSVPLADADEVFRTSSDVLADRLERIPDGETGDRHEWIHFQMPIIAATPGIAAIEFSVPDDIELPPDAPRTRTAYGLAEGVDPASLTFGNLRYADEAIASYERFRALKDEGVIPPHIRFQVSLPTALAVMLWIVEEDRPAIEPAYQDALLREVARMAEAIPHDQLAIQFDLCVEVFMVEGYPMIEPWFDDVWAGVLDRVAAHAAAVPDDVQLGFHLCYGDYKGERQVEVTDASNLVRLANEVVARVAHPVAFIQMPVPREADVEAWAPPLADLRLGDETHLYLGIVHPAGGLEEARELVELCGRYVDRFGVATECGIGRQAPDAVRPILEIHRQVAGAVA
jgi:hypothetical protein